jgi:hypothetical protein
MHPRLPTPAIFYEHGLPVNTQYQRHADMA